MTTAGRFVAVLLALALVLTGPLAWAQQPAQPGQPDLFQETLKASQSGEQDRAKYEAGAVVANVFYVPGKAFVCGFGAFGAVAVLLLTAGTGYKAASGIVHEGCGGKWALGPDDVRPNPDFPSGR